MRRLLVFAAIALLGAAAPSFAQSTVVLPNTAATLEGNLAAGTMGGVLGTEAFTNQFLYTSSLLTTVPSGSRITGFRVRVDGSATAGTYPRNPMIWDNYDVTLAQAATTVSTMSGTVAANMTNPQRVRSGSLTINADSFSANGAGPNAFGPLIVFGTPYVYQGGDLVFLVSHSAISSITGFPSSGFSLDATSAGFGSTFTQRSALGYNATTVNVTTGVAVIQLEFASPTTTAPDPGSLALLALGSSGLLGWRRRK